MHSIPQQHPQDWPFAAMDELQARRHLEQREALRRRKEREQDDKRIQQMRNFLAWYREHGAKAPAEGVQ